MGYNFVDVAKIQRNIQKKQATIEKRSRKMKTSPKKISVGWFAQSGKYTEQSNKPSVEMIANIHNYGSDKHTAKAFLETTIDQNYDTWVNHVKSHVQLYLKAGERPNMDEIASSLGELVKKDLSTQIQYIGLIDTGRLLSSIMVRYHRR